jgi:Flp pilus assembly protein TadD
MHKKYVVFVCTEVGVGHLLGALLHSAYYAFMTGRALALDMRRFSYAKRGYGHAMFLENFGWEFPPDLEVISDLDEVDRLVGGDDVHILLMSERLDVTDPFQNDVLIIPCMTPGQPWSATLNKGGLPFRITLKGQVLQAWERVMEAPQWRHGVVGMHFRAITGEYLTRMNPIVIPDYEERYNAIREQYVDKALEIAEKAGFIDPAFFVASDSRDFVAYIKDRLPTAFSVAEAIPDAGQSWQDYGAANKFDIRILSDVVIDIWALSASDYLMHTPQSAFTHFAIMNSAKLGPGSDFLLAVPSCAEIFDTLPAAKAVEWTRAAVRKAGVRRMEDEYPHIWLATALERAGLTAEAAVERQRAAWHYDSRYSQAVTMPDEAIDWEEVGRGNYGRTIEIARRVAERLPGNPYVLAGRRRSLSNLLAQQGDLHEATSIARKAVELDPNDPRLRAHLGNLLTRQSEYEEAEHALRAAIAMEPEDPSFHDDLSRCLAGQGRIEEAIEAIREAASIAPSSAKGLGRMNEVLLEAGRGAEAEAVTRDAVAQHPESAALHRTLGVLLERQGRLDEAVDEARQVIELEPNEGRWAIWLGELLHGAGRFADAEVALRKASELDPDSAHLHHVLSIALERQDKMDDASTAAFRAAEIEPLQAARQMRPVELLLRAGRFADAEAVLRGSMSRLKPGAPEYNLLSVALERQERLDEAGSAALQASEIEPSKRDRHVHAGNLLFRAGRWKEAEQSLRNAIELGDENPHQAHILSITLERQNRLDEAVVAARRAADLQPEPYRMARVGVLLGLIGRLGEAEDTLRHVSATAPHEAIFHYYLCDVLDRQGNMAEAIVEAERAVDLDPSRDLFRDRLVGLRARAERRIAEAVSQSPMPEAELSPFNDREDVPDNSEVSSKETELADASLRDPPARSGARGGGKRRWASWLRAR